MNRAQMAFRCPDAEMLETVKIEGYRLAFRHSGVATLLPEPDGVVDGVLWRISQEDEKRLDRYEGYPVLYGRDSITVKTADGQSVQAMVYLMNAPYRDTPPCRRGITSLGSTLPAWKTGSMWFRLSMPSSGQKRRSKKNPR